MKKYVLFLGTLILGAVAMTGCSKEESTEAYKHITTEAALETSGEEASEETENTAPAQTDNQAKTQNQTAETNSKDEETTSSTKQKSMEETSNGNVNKTTSNATETTKQATMVVTKKPSTAPTGSTNCPNKTIAPVATKAPVVTKKPTVTKVPTATKRPVATKAPSTNTDSGSSISSNASKVLAIINEERAKNGLGALTTTTALNNAATKRAKEIVSKFSHTRPDGTSGVTVLGEYNISYRAWGENIAYGQRSAEAVMDAWMNSDGHRKNILNSNFGKVGIGCYEQNGILYWTQVFTD